jgi:hypothetical protein
MSSVESTHCYFIPLLSPSHRAGETIPSLGLCQWRLSGFGNFVGLAPISFYPVNEYKRYCQLNGKVRDPTACPLPILDRMRFSLDFIMLLAVHNGGAARQLQESESPYPLPTAVLVAYHARLYQEISAFSYHGNTRNSCARCAANVVRSQR